MNFNLKKTINYLIIIFSLLMAYTLIPTLISSSYYLASYLNYSETAKSVLWFYDNYLRSTIMLTDVYDAPLIYDMLYKFPLNEIIFKISLLNVCCLYIIRERSGYFIAKPKSEDLILFLVLTSIIVLFLFNKNLSAFFFEIFQFHRDGFTNAFQIGVYILFICALFIYLMGIYLLLLDKNATLFFKIEAFILSTILIYSISFSVWKFLLAISENGDTNFALIYLYQIFNLPF